MFAVFDQSTVKTGWAVFHDDGMLIQHGVIDLHKIKDTDIRSQNMFEQIFSVVDSHCVDMLIFEGVAMQSNPQTLIRLGRLQGHIQSVAWMKSIKTTIYLPTQWRKLLGFQQGGSKRKELKQQSISYVKDNLHIETNEDEAEAICIGLAHLKSIELQGENDNGKEGKEG